MSNLNYDLIRQKATEERILMKNIDKQNAVRVEELKQIYSALDNEAVTKLRDLGIEVSLPEIDYELLKKDNDYKLQVLSFLTRSLDNIDEFISRYV